jgi:hypothetical protein
MDIFVARENMRNPKSFNIDSYFYFNMDLDILIHKMEFQSTMTVKKRLSAIFGDNRII